MVEQPAVNRQVAGSSPASAASSLCTAVARQSLRARVLVRPSRQRMSPYGPVSVRTGRAVMVRWGFVWWGLAD